MKNSQASGVATRGFVLVSALSLFLVFVSPLAFAQGTRLLRQPSISATHVAFIYGGDVWLSDINGANVQRITSTPAVESNPHLSPDGKLLAFSSNRSGNTAVYVVPISGGTPTRLTWHPSGAFVRGWSPDGKSILYASSRDTAPAGFDRLWTVPVQGGPSTLVTKQWSTDGSYAPDGKQLIIDRMDRWDVEWRNYRGGQNTPLVILNVADQTEKLLPHESTFDIQPVWLGSQIYFLTDRDWISNVWAFNPSNSELKQITKFSGSDVKWLDGFGSTLVFERDGYLFTSDLSGGQVKQLPIQVQGDFPWAETKWEDVTSSAKGVSISPTGKRILMESRGEIFTVPVENGDYRNLTLSSSAADRAPIWSPKGNEIAWFSDGAVRAMH